jgi:threonine synthase
VCKRRAETVVYVGKSTLLLVNFYVDKEDNDEHGSASEHLALETLLTIVTSSETDKESQDMMKEKKRGIWIWQRYLPSLTHRVSMDEGNSPFLEIQDRIKSRHEDTRSVKRLFFKNETVNPTGSFRDRAAALVVSQALSEKFDSLVVASDGNHGVSVAAYAAYAGLRCHCIVPSRTDVGKIRLMEIYGASVDTDSEETLLGALFRSNQYAEERASFQASVEGNSLSLLGQETLAFELAYEPLLEDQEYVLLVPTGSGSLLYSLWSGLKKVRTAGELSSVPHLCAVQIAGYDPITSMLHKEETAFKARNEGIFVSPLMIDLPFYKEDAIACIKESSGDSFSIEQRRVTLMAVQLARNFGFFVENASAAAIAALPLLQQHPLLGDLPVVIILTGSGIKTPELFPFSSPIHLERSPTELLPSSMKVAILKTLEDRKTASGKEIWRLMDRVVSPQVIYQHLAGLREKGFILPLDQAGKAKKYHLTPKGMKLLEALQS